MKNKRRDFLKLAGFAGAGIITDFINPGIGNSILKSGALSHHPEIQRFNMCGYAAPRLETVRIGFIGLGHRGPHAVERMSFIEGVEIKGLCDLRPEKVNEVKKSLEGSVHRPEIYTGKDDAWKKLCERPDIDLIY